MRKMKSPTPTTGMHPVLSSVVHLPFQTARKEVGCCEFAQADFSRSIDQHQSILATEFPLDDVTRQRLWHAMMAGEVIAVEYGSDETLYFHVRGHALSRYVDMRFSYAKDIWQVEAVTSIHQRPFWRSRWTTLLGAIAGMIVTGVTGFALANHGAPVSRQAVENWASVNGYILLKEATTGAVSNNTTSSSNATGTAAAGTTGSGNNTASANSTASANNTTAATPPAKPAVQTWSFSFHQGMTVHDISVFLQQHGLVKNAFTFDQTLKQTGVDKDIWPGTYTFRSDMNQNQILQELKSKPSH